jgi:hypothetical protein
MHAYEETTKTSKRNIWKDSESRLTSTQSWELMPVITRWTGKGIIHDDMARPRSCLIIQLWVEQSWSVQIWNVIRKEGYHSRCTFKWALNRHPKKSTLQRISGRVKLLQAPIFAREEGKVVHVSWQLRTSWFGECDFVSRYRIKVRLLEMFFSSVFHTDPSESMASPRCLCRDPSTGNPEKNTLVIWVIHVVLVYLLVKCC